MKKILSLLLSIVLLAGICGPSCAESDQPVAEWTVMFYLCGTDLESGQFHSATHNLQQIAETVPVDSVNVVIEDPYAFFAYARATYYVDNYVQPDMCDLFDLTKRAEHGGISTDVTHAVQDAIEEAVVYFLRSPNHTYSHGLSFWYKLNADDRTLDHFARTCKNPEQLAFFDAVSLDWEAPEWVYETAQRHPDLNRQDYVIKMVPSVTEDGKEAFMTLESGSAAAAFVSYELMYEDENNGIYYTLGESGGGAVVIDEETQKIRYSINFDGSWPTLAGVPLSMRMTDDTEDCTIFNVDVRIDQLNYWEYLRVIQNYERTFTKENGETAEIPEYELQGFWDGFNEHTGLPGRNIYSLSAYSGHQMTLYKLAYSNELGKVSEHTPVEQITVTGDMAVSKKPLPKGWYLYRFVVRDVFGNRITSGSLLPVNWDGKNVSYPVEGK